MSQIALPLQAAAIDPSPLDATGFEIGWDHARFRLTPPAEHLLAGHPVRQGWEAGRSTFGHRTRRPTRHVQRWLDLRLLAWMRGRAFEDVRVTPHFLAQVEATHCPVTREALTSAPAPSEPGAGRASDGVLMALNTAAGIAAGNLAMVSRRAAVARGRCSAAEAVALSLRIERGEIQPAGGLDAAQWLRLAVLLSMATPAAHARLAWLPLAVLPPNRVHVIHAVQALQVLLTLQFGGAAYGRRIAELGALMPDADARRQYAILMNTLLARRLAVGWGADRDTVRRALEDAWAHPLVRRRWEQLALRLTRQDCERIVRVATRRGLGGSGLRWLDDARAVEGWSLAERGRRAAGTSPRPQPLQGEQALTLRPEFRPLAPAADDGSGLGRRLAATPRQAGVHG
jgi:hypothetical protein